jgi:hypothetical protein
MVLVQPGDQALFATVVRPSAAACHAAGNLKKGCIAFYMPQVTCEQSARAEDDPLQGGGSGAPLWKC